VDDAVAAVGAFGQRTGEIVPVSGVNLATPTRAPVLVNRTIPPAPSAMSSPREVRRSVPGFRVTVWSNERGISMSPFGETRKRYPLPCWPPRGAQP